MVIQKLKVDAELSGNLQVIVRDETGLYTPSNDTGYGGPNGNPLSKIQKYVFELLNLDTNSKYRQVQSDDLSNTAEYHNPSIARIVNKENVYIHPSNFNLVNFVDGLYKLSMSVRISDTHTGTANATTEIISNVSNAAFLFANYKCIITNDNVVYKLKAIMGNNIVVDRPIATTFTSFHPAICTSQSLLISDTINDNINCAIAKVAKDCSCDNTDIVNDISEMQMYYWAMQRCVDQNDITQAYAYFNIIRDISGYVNKKCNVGC